MFDFSLTTWTLLSLFFAAYCIPLYMRAAKSPIYDIPTIGPSGVISSFFGILMLGWKGKDMVAEGYKKIPLTARWMVIVTGRQLIEDFRRAADNELSFNDALEELMQIEFTLGKKVMEEPYHVGVVRMPLTKSIAGRFADVQEEIGASFAEHIPAKEEEWLSLLAYETTLQVVSRASNRFFVGLPLCRDPDYRKLTIDHTVEVMRTSTMLLQVPFFLKRVFSKFFTNIDANVSRATKHLGPLIEERLERHKQFGSDDQERPNDLISWLVDYAKPEGRTVYDLTTRVLAVNFAAIHTTSLAFIHILFDLAAYPEYAEPLRQELLTALTKAEGGQVGLTKLHKLDSFIRESQRLSGSSAVNMLRLAMKDVTLSDGTILPKGHYVAIAGHEMHLDERYYPNPREFQGFRFSEKRKDENESMKHQVVSLGTDWTLFGGGKHACPGRFFAVNELKTMLAYVVLNYDVKLDGTERPAIKWFGIANVPNQKARLLFRRRKQRYPDIGSRLCL